MALAATHAAQQIARSVHRDAARLGVDLLESLVRVARGLPGLQPCLLFVPGALCR